MNRHSDHQLDHKGLATGVGNGPENQTPLPTPKRLGNRVGNESEVGDSSYIEATSQGWQLPTPAIANPQPEGLAIAASLFKRGGELPTPEGSAHDLLDNAAELRARVNAGMAYLYRNLSHPDRFARGRHRLVRLLVEEYRPALVDLAALTPRPALERERDTLVARLEVGMTRTSAKAGERFVELLTRYEALSDALSGDAVDVTLGRIVRLEDVPA